MGAAPAPAASRGSPWSPARPRAILNAILYVFLVLLPVTDGLRLALPAPRVAGVAARVRLCSALAPRWHVGADPAASSARGASVGAFTSTAIPNPARARSIANRSRPPTSAVSAGMMAPRNSWGASGLSSSRPRAWRTRSLSIPPASWTALAASWQQAGPRRGDTGAAPAHAPPLAGCWVQWARQRQRRG